jgi:hypothetical protein
LITGGKPNDSKEILWFTCVMNVFSLSLQRRSLKIADNNKDLLLSFAVTMA